MPLRIKRGTKLPDQLYAAGHATELAPERVRQVVREARVHRKALPRADVRIDDGESDAEPAAVHPAYHGRQARAAS